MAAQSINSENLAREVLAGNRRALARALTRVENNNNEGRPLLAALYPHTGKAHIIGITGPPGSGKSTLVSALTMQLRAAQETVAIVAVDPTSPFTGGAIMGDRIRMRALAGDTGVFIRSMATRGLLGGLARTTTDLIDVLDAAGFDRILIETVGAGQSEVDIAAAAHTTLVVEAPGFGDDVQAIKAGILEIADVLVLNKDDHPNSEAALRVLRTMLSLGSTEDAWGIPLLQTVATEAQGVDTLLSTINEHQTYLRNSGMLLQRRQIHMRANLELRLRASLLAEYFRGPAAHRFEEIVAAVIAREIDPATAIATLLDSQGFNKE